MVNRQHRSFLIVLGALGLTPLIAAGCGGGDDDTGGTGATASAGRGGAHASGGASGGATSNGNRAGRGVGSSGESGAGNEHGSGGTGTGGTSTGTGGKGGTGTKGGSGGKGGSGAIIAGGGNAGEGGETGPGGAGSGGSATLSHDDVLTQLGFDTHPGVLKDAKGNPLPASYNPLRKKLVTFHPRMETFVAGYEWGLADSSLTYARLFDDGVATAAYAPLALTKPSDSWADSPYKNAIAADIDGDGEDEFVAVYYSTGDASLKAIVFDPGNGTTRTELVDATPRAPSAQVVSQYWVQPSLAKGDFDGSGRDQVAVGWFGAKILKFPAATTMTVTNVALGTTDIVPDGEAVFVAGGDLDGDANDELAVSYSVANQGQGYLEVWDEGTLLERRALAYIDPDSNWGARTVAQAQVQIADVDGDNVGEVVFYGRTYGGAYGDRWQVFLRDDFIAKPATVASPWLSLHIDTGYTAGVVPFPFTTLDVNGDGKKEIFAYGQVFAYDPSVPSPTGVAVMDQFGVSHDLPRVAAGDIDGDGKDDLLFDANYRVYGVGQDLNGVYADKTATAGFAHNVAAKGGWQSGIIVAGNTDDDSMQVRYDDEHELLFTDPHILAILSSPPYYGNIDQDIGNTVSTFGQSSSTGTVTTQSWGVSVGYTIGTKLGFAGIGDATLKASIESSFDATASQGKSIEFGFGYSTSNGQDLVIYTTIPFDVYYYTVVKSATAADVNKTFTVNLPRPVQFKAKPPAAYNAAAGQFLKIDRSILGHDLGNPFSYPNAPLPNSVHDPLAVDVATEGLAYSFINLTQDQSQEQGISLTAKFEWEFEAEDGPVFGESVGFQYGHSYTLTASQTTTLQGTVGGIPADKSPAYDYKFGLMGYEQTAGSEQFYRLDYWVP